MEQACNPRTLGVETGDEEFKVVLGYIRNVRSACLTTSSPVSTKEKKAKQNKSLFC